MLFLVIVSLLISLGTLAGGAYVVVKARQLALDNIAAVEDFFNSETADKLSPFAEALVGVGQGISAQVGERVTSELRGMLGGSMKGVTAELEREAAAEDPTLAIMQGMPKSIRKNPIAYMVMQNLISKNMPAGPAGVGGGAIGGGNHNTQQPKFNL